MLRRVQPISTADDATSQDDALAFMRDAAADLETVAEPAPESGGLRRATGLGGAAEDKGPQERQPETPHVAFDPAQEHQDYERQSLEALKADLQWVIASERSKTGEVKKEKKRLFERIPPRAALLAVAVLAGGMAAFLAVRGNTSAPAPAQPVKPVTASVAEPVAAATEQVLVAKKKIGIGDRLNESAFGWEAWPKTSVHDGFLTEKANPDAIKTLVGSIARDSFSPGQPIIKSRIAASAPGYLSAVLGAGQRGVSVKVSAGAASGGFVNPGDHVDVILTRHTANEMGGKGLRSETLLSNVRVLAINSRLDKTTNGNEPDKPNSDAFQGTAMATLELDPTQSEVLINAAAAGQLSLVLRSVADFPGRKTSDETGANAAIRLSSPFWTK